MTTALRGLGYLYLAVIYCVLAAVVVASTWLLVVGGVMEIFVGKSATLGVSALDHANRDAIIAHGRVSVGLVKIFVIDPLITTAAILGASTVALPGQLLLQQAGT